MDELLQHCIRELAFEGDLGCDASRLRDFIAGYHKQTESPQQVDDAYCAFVWSIVAQQAEVRVGTAPEGAPEVYIAPQFGKRDLTKSKEEEASVQSSLSSIPDASTKSLDELQAEHGDALRIAVDPERSFVALTGSHIKPSSLTPPVYTCLQLIARGRENGLSAVDLSRKTLYDAKTCHYLIGKLVTLNIVVKLKKSGVGTNLCIHRYFFDKSESWKAVLAEEEATKGAVGDDEQDEDVDEEEADSKPGPIRFDPIDVQHLARISIVRARLEKLLRNCPNHTHKALNLLVAIGFSNPKKTERRFFQARLRELEAENFIETVQVRRSTGKYIKCIRLVDAGAPANVQEEGEKIVDEPEDAGPQHSLKATITLQRQMLNFVHASGTEGVTLNQITDAFGHFDKRALDFQINHLREPLPPPHLRHLGIEQTGETYGRERRYKYYTHDHYVEVTERESLDSKFPEGYFDLCGEFAPVDESRFYKDVDEFNHFVDSYNDLSGPGASKKANKSSTSRKRKESAGDGQQPKRGRKRKFDETVDGVSTPASTSIPDQPKKRGRPRKDPLPEELTGRTEEMQESVSAPAAPKKRGRPRKHPLPEEGVATAPAAPKKRGRPRKHPLPDLMNVDDGGSTAVPTSVAAQRFSSGDDAVDDPTSSQLPSLDSVSIAPYHADASQSESASAPVGKKRGRPRKHPLPEVVAESTSVQASGAPPSPTAHPADDAPITELISAPMRKRGRPRKHPLPEVGPSVVAEDNPSISNEAEDLPEPALSPPKRRGRPPKPKAVLAEGVEEAPKTPKRRGRPPKNKPQEQQDSASSVQGAQYHLNSEAQQQDATNAGSDEVGQGIISTGNTKVDALADVPPGATSTAPTDEIASVLSPEATMPPPASSSAPSPTAGPSNRATAQASELMIDPALLEDEGGTAVAPPEVSMESVSTAELSSEVPAKRPLHDLPSTASTSKRLKGDWSANYRSRTNITQSRRQKEVLQVLERVGGIINSSGRELYDEHTAEVEALSKAGELTSSIAGSRIDKRTMVATLDELESQGKIKTLKSIITSSTGVPRQIKVIYLPDTPEESVKNFLSGLIFAPPTQSAFIPLPSIKVVEEPVDYGGSRSTKVSQPPASVILLDQGAKDHDTERAAQLLRADEDTTRASLLTEPNTVIQQYGFIVGKIARVRELHLHVMHAFEAASSPSIASVDKGIIQFPYFSQELPVSVYAAVVSCRVHSDELLQLLATPQGRTTSLRDLSPSIQEAFEIHRARSRTRMLENLRLLETLELVVPLREATGDVPAFVTCESRDNHPTTFERTTCETGATSVAPQYWMFNSSAPLFLWALSEKNPPFYREMSLTSSSEAQEFWNDLQRISLNADLCKRILDTRPAGTVYEQHPLANVPTSVGKLLRRQTQWSTAYNFSWFQRQYLKKYIDVATATTPLQDEATGEARLTLIASIVSAPKDQVTQFYEHERDKLLKDTKRLQKRKADKGKSKEEHKASLAQKAAEAKAQRERDWDEMIARVHPEPLKGTFASRVRNIRSKFMQISGRDMQKWEDEVKDAMKEVKLPTTRPKPSFPQVPLRPLPTPPPLAFNPHEKSLDDIIAQQIPLMEKKPAPKKGKGKAKDKGKGKEKERAEDDKQRRPRFQWNKDLDELARDAAAIIRARCRGKRVQWAALDQIFLATTANSVRQRIIHLLELPGQASYMKRLEDRWAELWMRHHGTPELPDEDPGSPMNFDLKTHVKFLRNHIDKNALRVGLVQTEQPDGAALPTSVEALNERWTVVEKPLITPTWDFLWTGTAEEGREKQMLQQAFVMGSPEIPDHGQYTTEAVYVADTALKMTLATPNDVYDADRASQLLQSVDNDAYKTAMRDLQEQNVVSMLVRDPTRSRPGRPLKISDQNQNALGGNFSEELYQDACDLEEQAEADTLWREWPLLSSDGDVATLIELVSDGKLDFKVDTSRSQSVRAALDWNSKKADDDDIETAISIRYTSLSSEQSSSPSAQDVTMHDGQDLAPTIPLEIGSHGKTSDGEMACCAVLSTAGLIDCADCLAPAAESLLADIMPEEAHVARGLLDALEDAGPEGLTKEELQKMVMRQVVHKLPEYIARFTNANPSLAFWAGNKEIVLVSSHHASAWTVTVEQDDTKCVRMLPRRWMNIWGRVMPDVWTAACRAVIGIVHLHPGIPQMELRWRLKAVYDRQEVHDVLQYLLNDGFLRRDVRAQSALALEGPPSNSEEKAMLWSTNSGKRWYQVISQN